MLKTDFVDWELDEDNNLLIPIRYTFGEKAVKQGCRVRLQLMRTEWFLNRRIGMPFLPVRDEVSEAEALLGQPFDEAKTIAAIRSVLLGEIGGIGPVPGLKSLTTIRTAYDNEERIARVQWEGFCAWGDSVGDSTSFLDPLA